MKDRYCPKNEWKSPMKAGSHAGKGQKEVRNKRETSRPSARTMKKIDGLKKDNKRVSNNFNFLGFGELC